ncbi:putative MATE family efflux protein [Clostridium tetanomorphum]|uniref:MATE family efflux transporter n=1 Tax=Clostridium tetanomorphum TaxID=1553 RepID=UPI00044A002C|nr:MATE family efflux transporter [Clostridium tetanomorphum]KAJ49805.1 Multidrug resistance protein mdtK [Clostridium tetanomorphum DSM 665]MBP1865106.1 putative MATE family efflux protein [Clostridium tetanomorphum]NRS84755.1 putative MATE family efflux protein [Clostridium tetanomorphum]SQB91742.1 efflux pump protein [Clostridium tetanomorphum]
MKDIREKLLTESPRKLMFQLCTPAIIGMVVIGLYSFMDGVFAGQLVGEQAMGAISVAFPLTFFNSGISTLIGVGSASILSRAIGKKNQKIIDTIMGNLIAWVILFSTVIMILGLTFTTQLLQISGASGEILELGVRYLRIIFIGSIFVNFAQSANMVIRGEGLMKKAMLIMGFGAILNIILDPILMKIFGDMAIEGAAIATVISQIIQAVLTLNYFKKKSKVVKINKIKIDKNIKSEMFSVGSSAMMMQVLMFIQQTLLYRMAFKYGGDNQGILMAANLRIYAFSFIPLWGMSQGLQPVVGTNFGAGFYERVKKANNTFIVGATVLALVFWIPIEFLPKQVLSLFITNENLVLSGIENFRTFYSSFPLYGILVIMIAFFQSIGNGKTAGLLVMFRQVILFVPAILLLPKAFALTAVWFTQPLVDTLIIIVGIVIMFRQYKKMVSKFISSGIEQRR